CARAGRHRMTTTKNRKRRAPPRARRAPAGPRRRRPGGPRRGGGIVRAMLRPMAAVLVPLLLAACSRAQPGAPDAPGSAAPAPAAAGELTAEEQAIARAVDAEEERALALLARAVNINSGTLNLDGVRQVGALFSAELEELGFRARWVDGAAFGRAGHLVAERPGAGPKILLVGHLDTVFEPDSPFQTFERIGPDRARGPGVIDMKGGNVVIVSALRALAAAGALDRLHIVVVMNGDEESAGQPLSAARAALLEAARGADAAIGFEDGDGDPRTA